MTEIDLEQLVLHHVSGPKYQPVKARVLAKRLNLPKESHAEFKKTVKRLAREGRLSFGANRIVRPAGASDKNQITGVFQRTSGGFGFVRPNHARGTADRSHDVYIPVRKTLDAATGDVVLVRLKGRGHGGDQRPAGEITEVIQRETHQFVGTYLEDAGAGFVQIDGNVFSQPVLVGDAGAKNAQPDDKVVVEMVRFPSHAHAGEAVIAEVLGDRDAPGVDTLLVMREFGLPEEFPEAALEEARRQADLFDETLDEHRVDLTHLPVITIDPKDARDFDDAISLRRIANDHWQLGVHIADVAHFVRPDSALDVEARERATSVYLPDRVIPMLPEIISNNLASLQPDRVRFTRTVMIEMTPDGARVSSKPCTAAIKSRRRFTYEEVDDFLANRAKWKKELGADIYQLLCQMEDLAMILRQRRIDRGAIELSMPEIKLDINRQGKVRGAHRVENTVSHQIIEEFMLAANDAVAEYLRDRQLYFLRRIHESPDPRKLKALTEFIRGLNVPTESLESRFEIQRVLGTMADRPERDAVNYAVLRSMKKAVYSPQEEGHYALASDCYCHFTSPIRRYPDLTIHRLLEEIIRGHKPVNQLGPLLSLGEHCSDREHRAESAERELSKIKLLNFLSTRIGLQMDAVITGVQDFGIFAQGLELPAEGFIHVTSLADDYYDYDRVTHTLCARRSGNRYRLGDAIRVEIAHVDQDRRELDFRLVTQRGPSGEKRSVKKKALPAKKTTRPRQAKRPTKGKKKSSARGKKTRSSRTRKSD